LSEDDLKALKAIVTGELAKARAKNQGWTDDTKGTMSWLRDIFMSFFMCISATFRSETMFRENSEATEDAKTALGWTPPREQPAGILPLEGETRNESASIGERPTGISADADLQIVTASESGGTPEIKIAEDIVDNLHVIDTPRDGSCMLWSVIVGLDSRENFVGSNEDRMRARDVAIPEYRQAISLGLRQEAVAKLEEAKKAKNANWITDFEAMKRPEQEANDLEYRAQDIERSGGMDPTTWFGSIDIKPADMRFIAPMIRKDIAIVERKGNQSILHLCTKEGEYMSSQTVAPQNVPVPLTQGAAVPQAQDAALLAQGVALPAQDAVPQAQGQDAALLAQGALPVQNVPASLVREGNTPAEVFKNRFEAALREGPAIYAEGGHARCLRYVEPVLR
jgi:hypothetical protein